MTTPHQSAQIAKTLAREQGFDLVGITRAKSSRHGEAYRNWIVAGKQGSMDYLARGIDERLDITKKFPWAKSIVCVALAYWLEEPAAGNHEKPLADEPLGKIARYAWGRDYHKVIEAKLKRLEKGIRQTFGSPDSEPLAEKLQSRIYCDTGPILERELATRAGLGWIGKHTLLIHPRHGSWFLLGELILSLELEPDDPIADHCGTCRRCIEACPTNAITPYSVDATRCISYQTLENRGEIPPEFHVPMHDAGFILGCDICQEVCPFNRRPLETTEPDFAPRAPAPAISLQTVLAWQEEQWDQLTRGSATRRAKLPMWQRNARTLLQP